MNDSFAWFNNSKKIFNFFTLMFYFNKNWIINEFGDWSSTSGQCRPTTNARMQNWLDGIVDKEEDADV